MLNTLKFMQFFPSSFVTEVKPSVTIPGVKVKMDNLIFVNLIPSID